MSTDTGRERGRIGRVASTKERILEAALGLFNAEGAGALSALDVATALGISPGHLYYHFRGKPEIMAALARSYASEVEMILASAVLAFEGADGTLETLWTHVHILVEEAWDARFLYREAGAIALSQPQVGAVLKTVAISQRDALRHILGRLSERGALTAGSDALDGVARLMTTGIGFHTLELELEGDEGPPRERIARAAAQIMLLPVALAA